MARIRTYTPDPPDCDECNGSVKPGHYCAGCGRSDFSEGDES